MNSLAAYMEKSPLIAILRGIKPEEVVGARAVLVGAGIRIIEVPLNSPHPLESLRLLAAETGTQTLIGAGTVLTVDEVYAVAETGARLIVAPNADPAVIARAKSLGLFCLPGVATPSEAFVALKAGADGLKLFPAEALPPAVMKAWFAVLPAGTLLVPVGGISMENMAGYQAAGAAGFGIGSSLYKPGVSAAELKEGADRFMRRYREISSPSMTI
jgi:2-dehydro-3-deoxyphosphogalactonate aldolase